MKIRKIVTHDNGTINEHIKVDGVKVIRCHCPTPIFHPEPYWWVYEGVIENIPKEKQHELETWYQRQKKFKRILK